MQAIELQDTIDTSIAVLEDLVVRARRYMEEADAPATRRAHRADWRDFELFCGLHGFSPLPARPEHIVLYVTHLAKSRKVATIARRLASISVAHQAADVETPTRSLLVRRAMRGIRNDLHVRPAKKKPILLATLRRMVEGLPDSTAGKRDRALLLFTFASAMRRSEISSLNREDVEISAAGAVITIRKSKSDQAGEGQVIAVPFAKAEDVCAVRALQEWLRVASIRSGPIFRPVSRHDRPGGRLQARTVATIVKRHAARVGLDEVTIGAHSMRSGFISSCAAAGISERATMAQSRHKSIEVFRGYVQHATLFVENAAAELL